MDNLQLLPGNKRTFDSSRSVKHNKSFVWEEDFAEVMLDGEWVKVEIVSRERDLQRETIWFEELIISVIGLR